MLQNYQSTGFPKWPLLAPKINTKQKNFWTKYKKPLLITDTILVEGELMRVSKKNPKPKLYYYRLTNDNVLYYFKKQSDNIPKGMIQLDEFVQINIQETTLNKQPNDFKPIAISIFKIDKSSYKIYHQLSHPIFEWWTILIRICTINNFDEMYHQMEVLGKGSFATVYKVKRLIDSKIMAAKCYFKDKYEGNPHKDKFFQMLLNEIQILRKVNHPGLIQLHEIYQQADKIVLILDYVPGSDLYKLIKDNTRISESKASILIHNIGEALISLTEDGYVHRDLKLENIIVLNNVTLQIKVVDFGFAESIDRIHLKSKAGTPGYIPPEVFRNLPYQESGDMYSLGIILYSIVGGYSPFKGTNYQKIMQKNKDGIIIFDKKVWQETSVECQQLIRAMTCLNPKDRITFKELLSHKVLKVILQKWFNLDLGLINTRLSARELQFSQRSMKHIRTSEERLLQPKSFYVSSAKSIKSLGEPQISAQFMTEEKQPNEQQLDEQDEISPKIKDSFEMLNDMLQEQTDSIESSNLHLVKSANLIFNQPKMKLNLSQSSRNIYKNW